MDNFDDFKKSTNDSFDNFLKSQTKSFTKSITEEADENNKIKNESISAALFIQSMYTANERCLELLEDYHSWLIKNYNLSPKD